jgi:hypothetical protein
MQFALIVFRSECVLPDQQSELHGKHPYERRLYLALIIRCLGEPSLANSWEAIAGWLWRTFMAELLGDGSLASFSTLLGSVARYVPTDANWHQGR